jgi:hypothetical protein
VLFRICRRGPANHTVAIYTCHSCHVQSSASSHLFPLHRFDISSAHMLCVQRQTHHGPVPFPRLQSATVDISLLLKPKDEEESNSANSAAVSSRSASVPRSVVSTPGPALHPPPASTVPAKRLSGSQGHSSESPAKKQSKWSPDEDAKIIELRGNSMKWEDISKQLPGRSAISCRLHYQNYLERRSEWDEDRKNKLARLYERYVEKRGTRSILCNGR